MLPKECARLRVNYTARDYDYDYDYDYDVDERSGARLTVLGAGRTGRSFWSENW